MGAHAEQKQIKYLKPATQKKDYDYERNIRDKSEGQTKRIQ